MKILFMRPSLNYSGASKMLGWTANRMCALGHTVTVATMYRSEARQELDERVELVRVNSDQSSNWLYRNTIGMVKVLHGYRKYVKKFKPDVIVSFLDSVSYFYIVLNKLFYHDRILVSERVDPSSRKGWRARVCFAVMNMGDYAVFQTEAARDFFGDKYAGRSAVIPNPVVKNDSLLRAVETRISAGFAREKTIMNVGRLSLKQKRQDVLLDAFAIFREKYPAYKLEIFGGGQDEKKIRALVAEKGLEDSVVLMGQQSQIPEKTVNGAMFVMTSDYEGIPNALIEAMSVGLPCVSTDCSPGGARMVIDDGKNGFIVPCGDARAVADKMIEIAENSAAAEEMAARAMSISEKFSEETIAAKWNRAIGHCYEI